MIWKAGANGYFLFDQKEEKKEEAYLRVSNYSDDLAVSNHLSEIFLDRFLAIFIGPSLGVFGERFFLRLVPVFVG